jgi:RecB family exonuclease
VLRLAEPIEAADELDGTLKGNLFHAVLGTAATLALTAADQRAAILENLEPTFDAVAATMPQVLQLPAWNGRRNELLQQLRNAVAGEEFLQHQSRILATEQEFQFNWNGLRVRGRIDRIDQMGNERLVVDYKTSGNRPSGAKDRSGHLKLDVQLPIYMAACGDDANGEEVNTGYYYSLTMATRLIDYGLPKKRGDPGIPDHQLLTELAEKVVRSLASGSFAVDPDVDYKACEYCDYDSLCRKGPYLARAAGSTI